MEAPYNEAMEDVRDAIVVAIHELMDANSAAQEALAEGNTVLQCGLDFLRSGGGVTEALQTLPISLRREATQGALKRSVDARHELRLLAIAVCVDEGMPTADIAELWGMSRQRVGQCVRELKRRNEVVNA